MATLEVNLKEKKKKGRGLILYGLTVKYSF